MSQPPTLVVSIGRSLYQEFEYRSGGAPVDLSGWSATFSLSGASGSLLTTDTMTGGVIVDGPSGLIYVSSSALSTSKIVDRAGTWEIDISKDGFTLPILSGPAIFRKGNFQPDPLMISVNYTPGVARVETASVSRVSRVDRGPPGPKGVTGPAGPVVPVSDAIQGAVPPLSRGVSAIPIATSGGNALTHSKERIRVASYTAVTASKNAALQAACWAAADRHVHVQCENETYDINYLDLHGAQGVVIHGVGGPAFATDGTGFVITGPPGGDITGTSASTVTVGSSGDFTVTKAWAIGTGLGIVQGGPIRFSSSAGTIWGVVSSYDSGTGSVVVSALASTGSGSSSSWTFTAPTRPSIDFRSTIGCGIVGVQIRLPAGHMHRVIDTSWYNPSAPSDSSHFRCEDVGITAGAAGADAFAWHFYFGTTQSLLCENCRSTSALVGYFAGNGTATFESCEFVDFSAVGIWSVAAETCINSCTGEPGTSIGGTAGRLIRGIFLGPNSFGVASISNCVLNDASSGSTGYWVDINGMSSVVLVSNQIQSDSAQAPIRIRNSTSNGGLGLYGNKFNGCIHGVDCTGTTSPVQTVYKSSDNDYSGSSFMVGTLGTDYIDFVDESSQILTENGTYQGYGLRRTFGAFVKTISTYGTIIPSNGIDLSVGVDIVIPSALLYTTYSAGANTLATIVALDEIEIEILHIVAQPLTIINNSASGSGYPFRPILTGTGGNVVVAAASAAAPRTVKLRFLRSLGKFVITGIYP